MIVTVITNKVRSFFLVLLNVFRRALCCFRKRRHSYSDTAPLTHVVSNSETEHSDTVQNWSEWGDVEVPNKPKTVQDYIEIYRQQTVNARKPPENSEPNDEDKNLFEDMTPSITRQTKIMVGVNENSNSYSRAGGGVNRLSFREDANLLPSSELGEWEESSGWEGEQLESETQKVLREKKKTEREEKAWRLQQKRLEKMSRSLGAKVKT